MQHILTRIALITAAILLVPLIGNRYVEGWDWAPGDFLFAAIMIAGVQLAYHLIARRSEVTAYKAAVGVTLATCFALLWVSAAVGIIGEDNPANLLYLGVLAVGLLGSMLVRFEARGMKLTLLGMAVAQMIVPSIAAVAWPADFAPGMIPVFGLNAAFAASFVFAATLFGSTRTPSAGMAPAGVK